MKFPHKLTLWALAFVLIYGCGYGAARWRKLIVMREYDLKEAGLVVRHTAAGHDIRDDWRGRLKNRANPAVFFCFRPLCAIEDLLRGGQRPIR
jgi:hypothetical protein